MPEPKSIIDAATAVAQAARGDYEVYTWIQPGCACVPDDLINDLRRALGLPEEDYSDA